MKFIGRVRNRYKIVAIIPKEKFKKGKGYHNKFYNTFDKDVYKKVAPTIQKLFRALGGGKLKHTILVDFGGQPVELKPLDLQMIEALKKLGYEASEEMYKTGHVLKGTKEIPILDILKTKATKIRGYDRLKDQYEKTKNQNIKKELEFYDHIIKMDILDPSKKIDVRKLSIYDNKKAKIVFSYNHRLVASQSTGTPGWEGLSCMNLDKGENREYVGKGASGGEFVAFLAKPGDEYTLESPTARVLFKPYHGMTTKDIMWKADKTYGTAPGFQEYAQKIIDKHLKPKPDRYLINPHSYDDGLDDSHNLKPDKWSPEVQMEAVKEDGWAIRYIKNPTVEVQMAAVKQDGRAIEFIKNPTPEMQMEVVKQDGSAIQHIKNPTPEMQMEAVKQDGSAIKYIKNPTPEVVEFARSGNHL